DYYCQSYDSGNSWVF
nr:immunoglobulin light chain junction region [Macaca mulatta]MOX28214.1 immunoglobulin light chain junction region [Macaca mulatta]MOX28230.1 immunoglobulin light chain junction region [Macaca mulatta]MOX28448.1 immunoglobulin light chain junction region [Macaca mulatta]MOX28452.1 immunoglobulin light chain junction region [Macaca mulatta]